MNILKKFETGHLKKYTKPGLSVLASHFWHGLRTILGRLKNYGARWRVSIVRYQEGYPFPQQGHLPC